MSTAVSAPGKVFLAGGYLALDREYTAFVFGLSSRIHVLVHDVDTGSGVELSEIVVESPQFKGAVWGYGYRLREEEGGIGVTQLEGTAATLSRNPFVETALLYALTYISTQLSPSTKIKPTKITILADNDYYSNPPSSEFHPRIPSPFSNFNVTLPSAHKTGLGSSAALVTSFTGAVLSHYLPKTTFDLATSSGRSTLHNLSQAAHCAAQGKVGSGFDIATAVYGTCVYRRFSPSILANLGEPGSPNFATRVKAIVENTHSSKWDHTISKGSVTIPKGMALVMCDVDCGSETVGMVKKVLSWRAANPEIANPLWNTLQERNSTLAKTLTEGTSIPNIAAAFSAIREKIRELSKLSGVPIEPVEQTILLDAVTEGVEGVVGGVVPGAGGYDAIVLLIKDDKETVDEVKAFLQKWSREGKGNVKLLEAKGELEGARIEAIGGYGGGF